MPTPMEIDLYDEVSLWSVRGIVQQLRSAPDAPITLRINSPGGDVQEGFALANALRSHKGRKIAVIEGVCASAATFPACACDELHMHAESLLMIHSPWGGTAGDASELESFADVLKKMSDLMVGMYQRKTGADEETVRGWMSKETWMKPQEAKDAGFCDLIISADEPLSARARRRFAALVAKLKLPPVHTKRSPMAMKDELRAKLALHGLAEDGGNMDEAYGRYMSETEDGPADRKDMAKAMEEEKSARAKAEDDKKKEGDGEGAGHEEPDGDEPKAAIKALQRKQAAQDEKLAMMSRELTDTKKELASAHAKIKGAAELTEEVAEQKSREWAEVQISLGRVRGDHKGKAEDTVKWLAAKFRKDKAEAEDVLSPEGTFQMSERVAMNRYSQGGSTIGAPHPRGEQSAAEEFDALTAAEIKALKAEGHKDDESLVPKAQQRVRKKHPAVWNRYQNRNRAQ
jgi:ATP-dependent Clp protease protease subunit